MWVLWVYAMIAVVITLLGIAMLVFPGQDGREAQVAGARLFLLGWSWPIIVFPLLYWVVAVAFDRNPKNLRERYEHGA